METIVEEVIASPIDTVGNPSGVGLSNEQLEQAAYILKAIAHPSRLGIIALLGKNKELSVTEIQESIQIEQSLLSHHLGQLRARRILKMRKDGKNCLYSLADVHLLNIIHCIENCNSINY